MVLGYHLVYFETIFTLLLNSFTEHNFGQFLVSLAVFHTHDELIILLLLETMIS